MLLQLMTNIYPHHSCVPSLSPAVTAVDDTPHYKQQMIATYPQMHS